MFFVLVRLCTLGCVRVRVLLGVCAHRLDEVELFQSFLLPSFGDAPQHSVFSTASACLCACTCTHTHICTCTMYSHSNFACAHHDTRCAYDVGSEMEMDAACDVLFIAQNFLACVLIPSALMRCALTRSELRGILLTRSEQVKSEQVRSEMIRCGLMTFLISGRSVLCALIGTFYRGIRRHDR